MDLPDLSLLRSDGSTPLPTKPPQSGLPRHQQGELFLKGPIPWQWLERAAQLPGKTLHVAITLWQRAGMGKSNRLKLSTKVLDGMGVDRYAKRRALTALEGAGLVSVERHHGKNPIVTLLEFPDGD